MKVGRLLLTPQCRLEGKLNFAKDNGCKLVYIYSEKEIGYDSAGGFKLVDVGGQIKFIKKLTGMLGPGEHNASIIQYNDSRATSAIVELAHLSGHLSRFRVDPCLPSGSYEELYKIWIERAIKKAPKSKIYIYHGANRPVGLITSEMIQDTCTIGLLAVDPSCQGQGIATQLIKQIESLCVKNGAFNLEVKTQVSNVKAQSLYIKNSFSEVHRTFLYHAHISTCN
jgi:ribosomal protein S18 acetylase RimI-like enzyme